MCPKGGLRALLTAAVACRRAVGAIEFALVLPVLLMILIGIVEGANAYLASSKVTAAAQTMADLVTREECLDAAAADGVFRSADLVLTPLNPQAADYRIVNVVYEDDGDPAIDWRFERGTAMTDPTPYLTAATGLGAAGESVVVGAVTYRYLPLFGLIWQNALFFEEMAVYRPRKRSVIPNANC